MSVVVSDTSPLHYLILCGAETALPQLFSQVVIPPTVFRELQQPNTPAPVREWANSLPNWASVQTPKTINLKPSRARRRNDRAMAVDNGNINATI